MSSVYWHSRARLYDLGLTVGLDKQGATPKANEAQGTLL